MDATQHPVAEAWGAEIQRRRELAGWSRAQLADHVGVTRQMVRLWEEGEHAPSPKIQALLIDKLAIDASTIAQLIRDGVA